VDMWAWWVNQGWTGGGWDGGARSGGLCLQASRCRGHGSASCGAHISLCCRTRCKLKLAASSRGTALATVGGQAGLGLTRLNRHILSIDTRMRAVDCVEVSHRTTPMRLSGCRHYCGVSRGHEGWKKTLPCGDDKETNAYKRRGCRLYRLSALRSLMVRKGGRRRERSRPPPAMA